ncbi:class I adenylate-forming enzyme family protein [Rhodococcus opacus]|uniref:class I adenylate-forming enzyme family protein n=1 Tax=Rhodococcus opacus TaxID=37919 RepID=UPI0024750859|nr:class I adenylate-forming enzyme family protein [Rhodococcus opacus]MDH6291316.1 acyl-CoA synthetase (AMP-forming)/AMP-acid ligase II [Rhodococcus opacus]
MNESTSSSVTIKERQTVGDALDSVGRPTVGEVIRLRARENGDLDFVVSMTRRMSYAQAEAASARLARRMLGQGIGKGTRVGLYFSYSHEFVVAWLAASRIGALVMPLSTLFTPREIAKVLRIGDVDVLVTSSVVAGRNVVESLESALPGLANASGPGLRLPEAPFLRRVWLTDEVSQPWATTFDLFAEPENTDPDESLFASVEEEVTAADLGLVVYTSGSTADPKGVVHSQGALLRSCTYLDILMNVPGGGYAKILCAMPFFWIGGMLSLTRALRFPMTLLLIDKFNPRDALEIMERERGTGVMGWPTLIDAMRDHPDFESRDLSSAPGLVGGPSDVSTIDAPGQNVSWHRGMTETVGNFSGVEVKVIDSETGRELPDGEEGELLVRGSGIGVMVGYYKKEWSEAFDRDGWYHTGDRVYLAPGSRRPLFRDRFTEMIKSAGANVAPREVELTLEEFDEISSCFVFGIAHPERGEEVTAVIVVAVGAQYVQADITARARERLSAFKVPTRWILIEPETVTWLGSGKPDRRRLRKLIESGELS